MSARLVDCPGCHGTGKVAVQDVPGMIAGGANVLPTVFWPYGVCGSCGCALPPPSSAAHVCIVPITQIA